jgi:hypothetical protein
MDDRKRVQSLVDLRLARIQGFAVERALALVPADTLADIRARDPHPYFQVYSICHEGVSMPPRIVDDPKGAPPISWPRSAVKTIKALALRGVQFFRGHNEDSSTEGRESLGEVVADAEEEIGGVLHHVVVGYFPRRELVEDMDVCSQEGEWNFFEEAGRWVADKVFKITGIALARSAEDTPAFSGARRLAVVQAFEAEHIDDQQAVDRKRRTGDMADQMLDLTTVAWEKLEAELKRRRVAPSQLFTIDEVKKDRELGKAFDSLEGELKKLNEVVAAKDVELKKANEVVAAKDREVLSSSARARIDKLIVDRKLTEKQAKFVRDSLPQKLDDPTDAGLAAAIDRGLEQFKVAAKTFGVTEGLPQQAANTEGAGEGDDMTLAANNPLLEEDVEV